MPSFASLARSLGRQVKVPLPSWTGQGTNLGTSAKSASISTQVTATSLLGLTYTAVTKPSWVTVSPSGLITGTASWNDVGPTTATSQTNTVQIRATDASGQYVDSPNLTLTVTSTVPVWSTSNTLGSVIKTDNISLSLSALSDSTVSYTLNAGSSLPAGTALTTGGVLSGAITDATTSDTTYSFTVQATDIENQNVPQTFSLGAEAFVTKKLVSSDKAAGDDFGWSSSITDDGSRVVVGAFSRDVGGLTNAGQVYIYTRSGSAWIEEAILVASDRAANDWFGYNVSITSDGSRVAIGAAQKNGALSIAGAAYIFSRSGASWTQEAKLLPSDIASGDNFGSCVSLSDDGSRVAISAPNSNTGGTDAGAVYIFSRSGVSWTQEAKLGASDKVAGDIFGEGISLSGDGSRVCVGAPRNDPGGTSNAGAAYIFTRNNTSWTQEAKIIASDIVAGYNFGFCVSLSIDGSRVVVGAFPDASTTTRSVSVGGSVPTVAQDGGAAYIFTRNNTSWTQEAKISASDKLNNDAFGCSVSITDDGSRVAVGARYSDPGGTSNAGAAYIFARNNTSWTQEAKIIASDKAADDWFGFSVSLTSNGSRVVVGADANDPGGTLNVGAAYVYTRSGSAWTTVMT